MHMNITPGSAMTDARIPKNMTTHYAAVTKLTDAFCKERLSTEYAELCRNAAAALCRKRPSPLMSGKIESWACGIVQALGHVNWMFDKSNPLYTSAQTIQAFFGVSKSNAGTKAQAIRNALNMDIMGSPEWMLQSTQDSNPMLWFVTVNGFIHDIRTLPYEIQKQAYEKGLIPYIPADKAAAEAY